MRTAALRAGGDLRRPHIQRPADAQERPLAFLPIKRTAPDDNQVPALLAPCLLVASVASNILRPLLHPERHIAFRHRSIGTAMPMPKTSPHVNERASARHHDVGTPREASVAHAESPSGGEKALTHKRFRFGVTSADAAHDPAALLWRDPIHDERASDTAVSGDRAPFALRTQGTAARLPERDEVRVPRLPVFLRQNAAERHLRLERRLRADKS